ncbi:transcription termination/antitermination NusG family protein [Oceanobacillus oncorhynchi]|uniref:transcription termination/antitermination NusG family protein n=1 Tax=Oceanobacillus oncorhynchi TaxID=545501 RepID=UPI0018696C61|nr:transcription termination/antitermination NusG family protein [Oceanobacillus oncorhynchi]
MTYFALQVKTGQELKAKEMIKLLLKKSKEKSSHLIKAIYAKETYTQYFDCNEKKKLNLSPEQVTENDIFNSLHLDSLKEGLSNVKKQFDSIKKYEDETSNKMKLDLKKKMDHLTGQIDTIRSTAKNLKAAFPGYILIELRTETLYLPNELWQLLNQCPFVASIPSKHNIPAEEIDYFFSTNAKTEPDIEIQFEEAVDYDEVMNQKQELLHRANTTDNQNEEHQMLDEMDELDSDFVSEVNSVSSHPMMEKLVAFIKNKRKTVKLSLSLLKEIYRTVTNNMLSPVSSRSFLNQLKSFTQNIRVALE